MMQKKKWTGVFWVMFIMTGIIGIGCSPSGGDDGDESSTTKAKVDSTGDDGDSTFALTGSLALGGGSGLALVEGEETIIKATYAELEEDTATMDSSGGYDLAVKPAPFSITVFQNNAPVCTFMFSIGENKVGSMEVEADVNLGSLTCVDGQAEVPEEKIEKATKADFKEAVKKGAVDKELLATLTDPEGLGMQMLSFFDDRGDKYNPGGPGGDHGGDHGPGPGPGPDDGRYLALNCPDCGPHGGGEFRPIEPKKCVGAGYSVGDWAYRQFNQNYGENYDEDKDEEQDQSIFISEAEEEGKYDFVIVEQTENGEEAEIMEDIKLGGFGKEFVLTGRSALDLDQLKSEASEGIIHEILRNLDTGHEPPPAPTWTDSWCDPLNIVNEIRGTMGYDSYDNITSVFQNDMGGGGHYFHKNSTQRPLCDALQGDDNSLLTLEEFCYDKQDDGTLQMKTSLTSNFALTLCWAAEDGMDMGFWEAPAKDANGDGVKSCSISYHDENRIWHNIQTSLSESECQDRMVVQDWDWQKNDAREAMKTQLRSEFNLDAEADDFWVNWETIKYNMQHVCSKLRTEDNVNLQVCYNQIDKEVEPNRDEDWETIPGVWDVKLINADAEIEEEKARHNGGFNELEEKRHRVDQCSANFDRTSKELAKRKARINSIKRAVEIVSSAVDADGNKKYIKENVDKYRKKGEFSFKQEEMDKLNAVLAKAEAAMDGWQSSINTIKATYAKLKTALVKADAAEDQKCMPNEIGEEEEFTKLYSNFDKAFNGSGVTGDLVNRGIEGWQKAAFNHFQCMEYDQNIETIKRFGISAVTQGIKDSNSEAADEAAFLTEECSGHYDQWGKCVETVDCKVPAGGVTYIPFDELIQKGEISEGCDEITEKFAMLGRVLGHDEEVRDPWGGSHVVPKGVIRAKVLLMTKMPKQSCSITLKFPELDKDGCFLYENTAGVSWASLTTDQIQEATASDYTLQYEDEVVPMNDLASRQIVEIALYPNSQIESAAEEAGDSDEDTLDSFFE